MYQQKATRTVVVENLKNTAITSSIAECPEYIKLEIKPETLTPGERGVIQITFDSSLKPGYGSSSDKPKINMKMGENNYKGIINITANVIEDFSKLTEQELSDAPVIVFAGKVFNIGEITGKQIKSTEVEFENQGKSDLIIRNVEMNNNSFVLADYDKVVKAGGKGKLTINNNPETKYKTLNTRLNVIANDPKNSKTILRLFGTIKIPESNLKENKNVQTKVKNVDVQEAYKILQKYKGSGKLVALDVRTPQEYKNGCLAGAVNINVQDDNFSKIIQLLDKTKMYLVYCKSGIRSEKAINIMSKLGFTNLIHMNQGMDGWKENRLEVSDPGR